MDPQAIQTRLDAARKAHMAGDFKAAEEGYRKIIALDPRCADAHHLLGLIFKVRGKTQEAIASIGTAISLKQTDPAYFSNLGACYLDRKEHAAAEALLRKALDIKDAFGDAWSNLGQALLSQNRNGEADIALQRALELQPGHAMTLANLATVRVNQNRFAEALRLLDEALTAAPGLPVAEIGKAAVLMVLGRPTEALALAEHIIKTKPHRAAEAIQTKAQSLDMLGRLEEARAAADEGLRMMPGSIELLQIRVKTGKVRRDEPFFEFVKQFEAHIDEASGIGQGRLGYALGKAYEDVGDMEHAARNYARGAQAVRVLRPYLRPETEQLFAALERYCTPEFLARIEGVRNAKVKPIFILGMPRSGTTLTEQILSGHPQVFGGDELTFLSRSITGAMIDPAVRLAMDADPLCPEGSGWKERADKYIECLQTLPGYAGQPAITDKMPGNFRMLGLITAMLPDAKIIHCRRDPIDTCISCYTTLFTSAFYWSYDFSDLAHMYRQYWNLMAYWRRTLPGKFLEIRYEETVDDVEGTARKLLDWCDLPWEPKVVDFHKNERQVNTASVRQVRQPIYTSSMGRWKKWEPYIKPLLDGIGDIEEAYWKEKTPVEIG